MNNDPTSQERKKDHIELAFKSRTGIESIDDRFYYEPMLKGHPEVDLPMLIFAGKQLSAPIWVSSMTGGTKLARDINAKLAKVCKEFGLGMGLGSCRSIINNDDRIEDFALRNTIGDQPFYANLGIAQIEELIEEQKLGLISNLLDRLEADGLIVHVNPLQEWLQEEGDHYRNPPIDTIKILLDTLDINIIVKEVGQGMGYQSLVELLKLPLTAIEFAAHGGTNFSRLELMRHGDPLVRSFEPFIFVGHSAAEMVDMTNKAVDELGSDLACQQLIISGGLQHFLDGYYYINKSVLPSIYGQASIFLKYAQNDYEELYKFIEAQVEGLKMCQAFLRLK